MEHEELDADMVHHSIDFRAEWCPNGGQVAGFIGHNLGVPDPFVDVGVDSGNMFDERAYGTKTGQCGRRGRERHAARANTVFVELDSRLGAYGSQESLRDGDDSIYLVGGSRGKTWLRVWLR